LCQDACQCPAAPDGAPKLHEHYGCSHYCSIAAADDSDFDRPAGIELDAVPIKVKEVNIFATSIKFIQGNKAKWLETKGGSPFLPGNKSTETPTVFLWWEQDVNLWTVGSYFARGDLRRHGEPVAFPVAAEAALRIWGPKPAPLRGPASEAQIGMLVKFGVKLPLVLDKQTASDLISIELSSRRIDV
jgi:hypothetical protein